MANLVHGTGTITDWDNVGKIWDVAAGMLLVTEAGGRVTDLFGKDHLPLTVGGDPNEDLPVLAATPSVHEQLLGMIKEAIS